MLASGANAGTTSSSEQLIINQRISQAAVRRSNTALNYMGVIRTSTLDNTYGLNKSNPKGVTPLTQVTGAGLGWQTPQIRDDEVTTSKIAAGGVTQAKLSSKTYYAVWNAAGTAQKASTGVGTSKSSTGVYLVGPFPGDVSGCIYAPNVLNNSGASAGAILQGGNTFLAVQMTSATGANTVDAPGSVMVYCPGS
jgi:hypothetical protein